MSVKFYRESPGKFDSRTLSRKTLNRWTGRTIDQASLSGTDRTPFEKKNHYVPKLQLYDLDMMGI